MMEEIKEESNAENLHKKSVEEIFNLGYISQQEGRFDESIACYRKTIELNPDIADAYYNLGTIYQDKKQYDEAINLYKETLKRNPDIFSAYYNMGVIFQARKNFCEAITHYLLALKNNPRLFDAYFNLGAVYEEMKDYHQAADYYQRALDVNPDLAEAYNSLGNIYIQLDDVEKAAENYFTALTKKPHYPEALVNLGNLYRDHGRLTEAEKFYRSALKIKPSFLSGHSCLLFMMLYNPEYDMQAIFTEHVNFGTKCLELYSFTTPRHKNEKNPHRRLKIGYVSPDFRRHSVAYFIEPVLRSHHREQCETFCYSDVTFPDEVTQRIRESADNWRSLVGMTEEEADELIRKDNIDILVDLAGHTENNRLPVFARKPAPVQVSWIGYPATTGLSTMDYKIVDNITDPPATTEQFYTEKLIRRIASYVICRNVTALH